MIRKKINKPVSLFNIKSKSLNLQNINLSSKKNQKKKKSNDLELEEITPALQNALNLDHEFYMLNNVKTFQNINTDEKYLEKKRIQRENLVIQKITE